MKDPAVLEDVCDVNLSGIKDGLMTRGLRVSWFPVVKMGSGTCVVNNALKLCLSLLGRNVAMFCGTDLSNCTGVGLPIQEVIQN